MFSNGLWLICKLHLKSTFMQSKPRNICNLQGLLFCLIGSTSYWSKYKSLKNRNYLLKNRWKRRKIMNIESLPISFLKERIFFCSSLIHLLLFPWINQQSTEMSEVRVCSNPSCGKKEEKKGIFCETSPFCCSYSCWSMKLIDSWLYRWVQDLFAMQEGNLLLQRVPSCSLEEWSQASL